MSDSLEQEGEEEAVESSGGGDGLEGNEALVVAVGRYRELVAGLPGLVPEMVRGSTVEEVDASAEAARHAYSEISRRITEQYERAVPTGNPPRSAGSAAYESLKPEAKIALGLRTIKN